MIIGLSDGMLNLYDGQITEYRILLDEPIEELKVVNGLIIGANKTAIITLKLNIWSIWI